MLFRCQAGINLCCRKKTTKSDTPQPRCIRNLITAARNVSSNRGKMTNLPVECRTKIWRRWRPQDTQTFSAFQFFGKKLPGLWEFHLFAKLFMIHWKYVFDLRASCCCRRFAGFLGKPTSDGISSSWLICSVASARISSAIKEKQYRREDSLKDEAEDGMKHRPEDCDEPSAMTCIRD